MLLNKERAYEIMDREGLDALVAVSSNNILYLSNFDSDFLYDVPWVACAILPRDPNKEACNRNEAAVLIQQPTWMPKVKLYYFGTYGGILKVHTFAENLATDEDRDIASLVKGMEDEPYMVLPKQLLLHLKLGLDKSGKVGIDDTRFVAALEGVLGPDRVVDATNFLIEIRW